MSFFILSINNFVMLTRTWMNFTIWMPFLILSKLILWWLTFALTIHIKNYLISYLTIEVEIPPYERKIKGKIINNGGLGVIMTQKGRLFHEFLWMNKFIIGYFYPLNVIFYIIQANFIVTYLYTHHPDRESASSLVQKLR